MYLLSNGTETTAQEIFNAFAEGKARLIHSWKPAGGHTRELRLDGVDLDTRGQCYSMRDEVWTSIPASLKDCYAAAFVAADGEITMYRETLLYKNPTVQKIVLIVGEL